MKPLYVPALAFLLFSCNKPKQKPIFTAFDFSYDAVFSESFSIKFTRGDTVFVHQRFTRSSNLKRNITYYSVINNSDKTKIDSFIKNTDFSKFHDSYFEPILDGTGYQFYVEKDTVKKKIYGIGDSVPPQLSKFADWLANLKNRLKLIAVDTTIEFGSSKNFIIPEKDPPSVKFLPPKKKTFK